MAKSIDADIVLVDTRGGVFIQDIVRVEDGVLSRPILMDLGFVNKQGLSALCRKYDVRIFDRTHFLPLGVPPAKSGGRLSRAREARRDYLKDIGCGQKPRSEEHTSELQSLMPSSYSFFCLKKKKKIQYNNIY